MRILSSRRTLKGRILPVSFPESALTRPDTFDLSSALFQLHLARTSIWFGWRGPSICAKSSLDPDPKKAAFRQSPKSTRLFNSFIFFVKEESAWKFRSFQRVATLRIFEICSRTQRTTWKMNIARRRQTRRGLELSQGRTEDSSKN